MQSLWLNLIWKEWCEHRWKLLSLCAISVCLVLLTKPKPGHLHEWFDGTIVALWMFSVVGAVFVGLGVAAGENSHDTRSFIESQPLKLWKLGAVKLAMGALTAMAPAVLGVGLLAIIGNYGWLVSHELKSGFNTNMAGVFGIESLQLSSTLICAYLALGAFLWTVAVGVNTPSEVKAALWALGFVVLWFTVVGFLSLAVEESVDPKNHPLRVFADLFACAGPLGMVFAASGQSELGGWLGSAIGLTMLPLTALVFIARFPASRRSAARESGKHEGVENLRRQARQAYLAPPLGSPLRALAWKGFRECWPIVGIGLVGALGSTLLIMAVDSLRTFQRLTISDTVEITSIMLTVFGLIVAVVTGIAAVLGDLSPGLGAFWRSRPIRPDASYGVQIVIAMVALMLTFSIPLDVFWITQDAVAQRAGLPCWATAFLIGTFSLAVGFAVLTRHAIYSAILAFGVSLSGISWLGMRQDQGYELWWCNTAMLLTAAFSLLVAWVCYRQNWALRS